MFDMAQAPTMTKTALCTISTRSHIFKSKVLLGSAREHTAADLFCLLTDSDELPDPICGETYHTLSVLTTSTAQAVKKKYTGNELRWACKPLYMLYLFEAGYERVIYVDNDICFFSPADFLFDALNTAAVLLTPHHYPTDPEKDQHWLEANYRVGLYNAGFIGAGTRGKAALEWWAKCCLYTVRKSAWRGLFDDQKYLDLMPVEFDGVEVLRHKGCNVAGWNVDVSRRVPDGTGKVTIDGHWPIVFIHFAALTFRNIQAGKDPYLAAYKQVYVERLKSVNPIYSEKSETQRSVSDYLLYLRHIRWRLIRMVE